MKWLIGLKQQENQLIPTNAVEEVNSVSNVIDDTVLNRDERSLREPTIIGKNDISNGKNNSNINSQVFASISYASIVKQPKYIDQADEYSSICSTSCFTS